MKLELSKESGYVHRRANKINNNTMPMEYEFSMELHKKLKEKINGKIFSKVTNDTLIVRIDMDNLWFKMKYEDFSERVMLGGLSTDMVVNEVCDKYRKFLINRMEEYYFKKGTEVN